MRSTSSDRSARITSETMSSWIWQLVGLGTAYIVLQVTCILIERWCIKKAKEEQEDPVNSSELFGILEPILVYFLYWYSKLTPANRVRKFPKVHSACIDLYVFSSTVVAFLCAWAQWGACLWLIAAFRIWSILIQALMVGVLRKPIRARRGDIDPVSKPRVVLLSFLNWVDLIALYALLYQAINGHSKWLYQSLSTQMTMGHVNRHLGNTEKFVVATQCGVSFFVVTALISRYMSAVADDKQPTK